MSDNLPRTIQKHDVAGANPPDDDREKLHRFQTTTRGAEPALCLSPNGHPEAAEWSGEWLQIDAKHVAEVQR